MRSIVYRNHFPLGHNSRFDIYIINMYADAAAMRVGADVCNIFFLSIHI